MDVRTLLRWSAGFLAFPVAGLAGRAVAGPVDDPVAALVGGAVTALVIGAGQVLAAGGWLRARRWLPATALGGALGLTLGAAVVGYRTALPDLAVMGLLTGIPLGIAQSWALPVAAGRRWVWAAATGPLWALGWTVTALAGVDVEARYTIFGASGALTVCVLSGVLVERLRAAGAVSRAR